MTIAQPCSFGLLTLGLLTGCATVVPFEHQRAGLRDGTPHGIYTYAFHAPSTGTLHGRLAAEPTRAGFRANTRPHTLGQLLGGAAGWWVNVCGLTGLPAGVLVRWESTSPDADRPGKGAFRTPVRNFRTVWGARSEPVELRDAVTGQCQALLQLEPADGSAPAAPDFAGLTAQIESLLTQYLFDEQMLAEPGMQSFLKHLRTTASLAQDETEYWMGFQLAARHLTFSHLGLYRQSDPPLAERLAQLAAPVPGQRMTLYEEDSVLTLRITDFAAEDYDEIDRAFVEIGQMQPSALIVDLRGTPGGTYTSLRVAAHLIDQPAPAGVLFGRAARPRVLAGDLGAFPRVTALSSVDDLRRLLAEHGAVVGWIEPAAPYYDGPVVLLIDRQTASAAEPLAACLQELGRATLIGEPTAGAMLSTQTFELADGWRLTVPTADYITAKGVRLDSRGVQPDQRSDSTKARAAATSWLRKRG